MEIDLPSDISSMKEDHLLKISGKKIQAPWEITRFLLLGISLMTAHIKKLPFLNLMKNQFLDKNQGKILL
jgi:hypothetical protein